MMPEPTYGVTVRFPASVYERMELRTKSREKGAFIVRAVQLLLSSMDAAEMEAKAREGAKSQEGV